MRISDWSSDVCSSDLEKGICIVGHFDSNGRGQALSKAAVLAPGRTPVFGRFALAVGSPYAPDGVPAPRSLALDLTARDGSTWRTAMNSVPLRSEEHTSELQSLMRISYAVFCLKKKKQQKQLIREHITTEQHT